MLIIIILTTCLLTTFLSTIPCHSQETSSNIQLKGGLIFQHEGPRQINQDTVQFLRHLDTTSLQQLAQKSQDTVKLYQTFCDLLTDLDLRTNNDSILPFKRFVKTVSKHKLSEALSVCTSLNAVLPEIHDKQDFTKLREYAFLNNIKNIPSGLIFDKTTNSIRFTSNHKNAENKDFFHQISYGGAHIGKRHLGHWKDYHILEQLLQFPLYYQNPNNFGIRVADRDEIQQEDYIICEQMTKAITKSEKITYFTKIAAFSCTRDLPQLQRDTSFAINELEAITTLNFTLVQDISSMKNFFQLSSKYHLQHHKSSPERKEPFHSYFHT